MIRMQGVVDLISFYCFITNIYINDKQEYLFSSVEIQFFLFVLFLHFISFQINDYILQN